MQWEVFWAMIHHHAPQVYNSKLPRRIQDLLVNERRVEGNSMDIGRNDKIKTYDKHYYSPNPTKTKADDEQKKQDNFIGKLPFLTRGFFHKHIDARYQLNVRLKKNC